MSQERIVIAHLASISLTNGDAKSLYFELVDVFEKYSLDSGKLCSVLMDSCSTMRGNKTGLETRIRKDVDCTTALAKHH